MNTLNILQFYQLYLKKAEIKRIKFKGTHQYVSVNLLNIQIQQLKTFLCCSTLSISTCIVNPCEFYLHEEWVFLSGGG